MIVDIATLAQPRSCGEDEFLFTLGVASVPRGERVEFEICQSHTLTPTGAPAWLVIGRCSATGPGASTWHLRAAAPIDGSHGVRARPIPTGIGRPLLFRRRGCWELPDRGNAARPDSPT